MIATSQPDPTTTTALPGPVPGLPDVPVRYLIGGKIPIRFGVFAAPMCGASKLPYRRLARRHGADIVYTEMVKAYPLVRDDRKTKELLFSRPDEAPCGPQICGGDPDTMGRAAAVLEGMGFPLVDINMGCPVKRVVNEGAGAALLKDPKKVEAVIRACVSATTLPVTVKIRSGWDHQGHVDAAMLALAAEAGGASLITIHGRVRSQHHQGAVDFEGLARAKAAVRIPVVANGGVNSAEDAVHMVRATGCDGVMIGRGAYGRPWLFRDVARALAGLPLLPPTSGEGVCDIMSEHLEGMLELMGSYGVLLYRKYASWYFRDLPWGAHFRGRAYRTREPDDMRALLADWRTHVQGCAAAALAGEVPPVPAFLVGDPAALEPFPDAADPADDDEACAG
jgi:tRNA-dihydrouridine synthase B